MTATLYHIVHWLLELEIRERQRLSQVETLHLAFAGTLYQRH